MWVQMNSSTQHLVFSPHTTGKSEGENGRGREWEGERVGGGESGRGREGEGERVGGGEGGRGREERGRERGFRDVPMSVSAGTEPVWQECCVVGVGIVWSICGELSKKQILNS